MKFFTSNIYTVAQYDFKRLDEENAFDSYEKVLKSLRFGEIYALNNKTIKDINWE